MKKLTSKDVKVIGDDLGINWNDVALDEFTIGVNVEFEHGSKYPATNITKNNKKMFLNLAISYGGKWDILSAVKKIVESGVGADKIDEKLFFFYKMIYIS